MAKVRVEKTVLRSRSGREERERLKGRWDGLVSARSVVWVTNGSPYLPGDRGVWLREPTRVESPLEHWAREMSGERSL